MEAPDDSSEWKRPPLFGQRMIWTSALLVLAVVGLHYGNAAWNDWVRRGLGW